MIDVYELSRKHFQEKMTELRKEKNELVEKYNTLIDYLNKSKSKVKDLKAEQKILDNRYNEIMDTVSLLKKFRFIWTLITAILVVFNAILGASFSVKLSISLYGLLFYYFNPVVLLGKGKLESMKIFGYRDASRHLQVLEMKYNMNKKNINELEKNMDLILKSLDVFYDRIEQIKKRTVELENKIGLCENKQNFIGDKKESLKCKVRKKS